MLPIVVSQAGWRDRSPTVHFQEYDARVTRSLQTQGSGGRAGEGIARGGVAAGQRHDEGFCGLIP